MDTKTGKPKTDSPNPTLGTQRSHVVTAAEERTIRETIGCAIDVHREVGPGFAEAVYHRAMCLALSASSLRFSTEHQVEVTYRGHRVGFQRLDLVVEGTLAVELKSVERLDLVHKAQLLSYLRAAKLRAGLLFNFNATPVTIRRVVL
jgi:GxxExxY protein